MFHFNGIRFAIMRRITWLQYIGMHYTRPLLCPNVLCLAISISIFNKLRPWSALFWLRIVMEMCLRHIPIQINPNTQCAYGGALRLFESFGKYSLLTAHVERHMPKRELHRNASCAIYSHICLPKWLWNGIENFFISTQEWANFDFFHCFIEHHKHFKRVCTAHFSVGIIIWARLE